MAKQQLVAGHLQEKKGNFYVVLNLKTADGRRQAKWIPTGLPAKGNKKRAETFLTEQRQLYTKLQQEQEQAALQQTEQEALGAAGILFTDFMEQWLSVAKCTIEQVTYSGYCMNVRNIINPYFSSRKITLADLTPKDIQDFYTVQLNRVKATTVIAYHANIHSALEYAVDLELIAANPADRVKRPKKERFEGSFYSGDELNALFTAAKGNPLELPILFGAFYGMRRSEIIGLKWNAIDFSNNTITVKHTVTTCVIDGKRQVIEKDRAKSKASLRTLPLVPEFRKRLLALKEEQERNRKLCGNSYSMEDYGYLFVDPLGKRMNPERLSRTFPAFLQKHQLRRIRFHDLRHSCASLLLANGVPMKQIQEWLGHSDFSTTANFYAHLEYQSKIDSAAAMKHGVNLSIITTEEP